MKFLIDECLHTSLVAIAQGESHDCFHVNWLGLSGETDWDLMKLIVAEDYTFVTNTRATSVNSMPGKICMPVL